MVSIACAVVTWWLWSADSPAVTAYCSERACKVAMKSLENVSGTTYVKTHWHCSPTKLEDE